MIPVPSGGKVWLALGHTDMRRGMRSLALQVQQSLNKDVHAGDLYVFRGRSGSLLVGSDRGGQRAAIMFSLFGTARLNDVDPLAWFTDVLARIADILRNRLDELLPWKWKAAQQLVAEELAA